MLRRCRLLGVPDVQGYLRRLGLDDPGPPTAEALAAIHRAQVERVPYTTLDIHLGRSTTVDPSESFDRVVTTGRAGYCFHCNGALAMLLRELGYDARWHRGGVWSGPEEVPLRPFANHLALTVHGLPTAANPHGVWFVDAGLGDALHEPVPLHAGDVRQGPFAYSVVPSPALEGGWRFRHDPSGSFVAMDFEPRLAGPDDFVESHRSLSTSPDSPFVRFLTAARRDATGVDKLVSCSLLRREGAGTSTLSLRSPAQWRAAWADVFGLTLDDMTAEERDALWRRARQAQQAWDRSQHEP
jgi:N-hydroxyarylamine O-acetyltransferase